MVRKRGPKSVYRFWTHALLSATMAPGNRCSRRRATPLGQAELRTPSEGQSSEAGKRRYQFQERGIRGGARRHSGVRRTVRRHVAGGQLCGGGKVTASKTTNEAAPQTDEEERITQGATGGPRG